MFQIFTLVGTFTKIVAPYPVSTFAVCSSLFVYLKAEI
jgi:hypothetical protein